MNPERTQKLLLRSGGAAQSRRISRGQRWASAARRWPRCWTAKSLGRSPAKPVDVQAHDLRLRPPRFPAQARAMISLFMHGGPSHVDLLDPKSELTRLTAVVRRRSELQFRQPSQQQAIGQPLEVRKRGQCGTEVSELLPHLATIVDDLCVVRSMHTGHNGHEVSIRLLARRHRRACRAGRRSEPGWCMASGCECAGACRPMWCCRDPAGHPVDGDDATGRAASCRRSFKGPCCPPQEPRILNLDPPDPSARRRASGRTSTLLDRLNRRHLEHASGRSRSRSPHRQLRAGRADADRRPRKPLDLGRRDRSTPGRAVRPRRSADRANTAPAA